MSILMLELMILQDNPYNTVDMLRRYDQSTYKWYTGTYVL